MKCARSESNKREEKFKKTTKTKRKLAYKSTKSQQNTTTNQQKSTTTRYRWTKSAKTTKTLTKNHSHTLKSTLFYELILRFSVGWLETK